MVLGKTENTPPPLCPEHCMVQGTVSLFMRTADGERSPYKLPKDGRIYAWSLDLADITGDQADIFTGDTRFKAPASARIGVVKPQGNDRFKLLRQSPKIALEPFFGSKPIVTLKKPLNARKGDVVVLTLPGWAPSYYCPIQETDTGFSCADEGNFARRNLMVASRTPEECTSLPEDILGAKPQQKIGGTRRYGCKLDGERMLYRAFWAPRG